MPPTSPATNRLPRAFTFVEILLVVFLLMLLAAAVVPNVVALQRSRRAMQLEGSIARLPGEARAEAVSAGMPMRLTISDNALVLEKVPSDGDPETVAQVALGQNVQVTTVETNGQAGDATDWHWTVYPDGSADDAGIEFAFGATRKSLVLTASGDSQWVTGSLNLQPTHWPAGRLQQRG